MPVSHFAIKNKPQGIRLTTEGIPQGVIDDVLNGTIKHLNLEGNNWDPNTTNGSVAVGQLLGLLSDPDVPLRYLTLNKSTNIAVSLKSICEAIAFNRKTKISYLSLLECGVDDQACVHIANMMRENTSIIVLNLNNGRFSVKGLETLEKALQKNYYFEECFVYGNPQLRNAKMDLYTIIARNKQNNNFKGIIADSIKQDTSVRWGRSKLMVIGQGGAGKTSTVRALLGKEFNPNWDSTIGADLKKTDTTGWQESNLQESDFNEAASRAIRKIQEDKKANLKKKAEDAYKARMLAEGKRPVGVVTRVEEKVEKPVEKKVDKKQKNRKNRKKSISEGKTEKPVQTASTLTELEAMYRGENQLDIDQEPDAAANYNAAADPNAQLVEEEDVARRFGNKLLMSAVNDESYDDPDKLTFTIWDYGGQTVFYTLHHLFLTQYGVYLLAFDMTKVVRLNNKKEYVVLEEAVEYLQFWVNSVMLHAPVAPLILVGTHMDGLPIKKKERIFTEIDNVLRNIIRVERHKALVHNNKYTFFPVDNRKSIGISDLRESITNSAKGKYYVDQKVPLRWVLTCDMMLEDEQYAAPWHKLQDVRNWGQECGINSATEVEQMLRLFHELGVLIYLSSTGALRDRVVSEPQWLLNKIGMLIRDDMHGMPEHVPDYMKEEWQQTRETGIVSLSMLEILFADDVKNIENITKEELQKRSVDTQFLVDLMKHAMLISDWSWSKHENEIYFVVPSLLRSGETNSKMISDKISKYENPAKLYVDFSKFFLPIGVFQRFVCMLVNMTGKLHASDADSQPTLGADYAFISLNADSSKKKKKKKSKKKSVGNNETKEKDSNSQVEIFLHVIEKDRIELLVNDIDLAPNCLKMMLALMRKLREEVMGSRLEMDLILCRSTQDRKSEELEYFKAKESPDFDFWFKQSSENVEKKKQNEQKKLDSFIDALM